MRIISNFHDYYDSLQDGSDRNIYHRITETIKDSRRIYTCGCDCVLYKIGFCGKIYPAVLSRSTHEIFYTFDEKFYSRFKELESNYLHRYSSSRIRKLNIEWRVNAIRDSLNKILYSNHKSHIFEKHHTPCFIEYPDDRIEINPKLSNIKFYRKFSVEQTFQEIEMYLFGVLSNNENKIPPVSNRDMIQAKGFDLKYSFRKSKAK